MAKTTENYDLMNRKGDLPNIIIHAPVGILTFTSDWKIDFVNENFTKYGSLYKFEFGDLPGSSILERKIFPNVNIKSELLSLKEGYSFEKEIKHLRTLDKSLITLIVKAAPVFHNDEFAGGILIVEDIKVNFSDTKEKDLKLDTFEKIVNKTTDLILVIDASGEIKYSYGRISEASEFAFQGLNILNLSELFTREAQDKISKSIGYVRERKTPDKLKIKIGEGENEQYFECKVEPLTDRLGHVRFIFCFFTDITELVSEQNLLTSEVSELKQYQLITDSVTDALFALDSEGKVIYWNKSSESLFGYTRSEVFGKFIGKVLDVFDDKYFEGIKEDLRKFNIWKINLTVYKKDGDKEIIDARFSSAGGSGIIIALCSNITERTQNEQSLKASEEKFRNIVTQAAELIFNLDPDGKITYANPTFIELTGYDESELNNKNFEELISPEYYKTHGFNLKSIDSQGRSQIELPLVTRFGHTLYLVGAISHITLGNRTKYYNCIFTDVTGRKASEKDLVVFKSIFEAFQDGIAVVYGGRIVITNEAFSDIFGYRNEEELNNHPIIDLISVDDSTKVSGYIKLAEQKKEIPERFEFMGMRSDRAMFHAEASLSTFESENKIYVVMVARDISEKKRSQQVIKESEEKYRNITENIDDFLFTFERIESGLRPIFYTASVERITGYSQSDLLSDSRLIIKMIYPDDFPGLRIKLKNLMKSRIQLSGEFEFRIINKHGNIVWVRTKLNLIRGTDGKIQKIYGLVSDITLRKKAEEELNKSTENLVKLNETKDRFISIISHDLRTPFSSILGFTDLLLGDADLSEEEKKQYIEFIQESSRSMLSMVNSLLDWTRLQTGRIRFEPERIEAMKIIDKSFNALSGVAFQKGIRLSSDIQDDLFIFVDQDLILQVINNLISNAIKFTNEGGEISLSASPSEKMRFLQFSVKDNGIGIKPENLKKLFNVDTKYTSEGTAGEKGTGLGLSLVKEIIDKHGGEIWVESVYGEGTEFKFTLPVASANILLVDNNKTDRILYSKILKNITPDYNIEMASDGKDAIEKIKTSTPALVITEHEMPNMNGYEMILELKKLEIKGKPQVLILSSKIDRITIHDYNELGVEFVFQKPVNLSSFKQAVEKSLRKGLMND